MFPPFDYFTYRRVRDLKRKERTARFASLPPDYHTALSATDRTIINKPIEELVESVHNSTLSSTDVLRTYGKVAIKAQERTNCVTELLLPEAETWVQSEVNLAGPLAGIPVSLKDSIQVKGFDTSVGYARMAGKPALDDGPMVKLLKDAGAVPYAKTALPVTLLSFESFNGLWGRCLNPHVPAYSPGGSTGGEGALLALGGRIGIGSDVAGSVRVPAAWSGIYSLRCSTGRWPKAGVSTSMAGQEGIASVFSPMARTLNDLTYFTRAIVRMQPWKYDNTVHPIAWRDAEENEAQTKKLRIGLMSTDGVVPPTPAIARAVATTVAALTAAGHTVSEITPPATADPFTGLDLASQLLNSDGCTTFNSHRYSFEPTDPGAAQLARIARLPRPLRYLYYLYVRYIRRDSKWAALIRSFNHKSAAEQWKLVAKREAFRATWHSWWDAEAQGYDFILCPVNATPALPHKAMHDAVSSCGYTFLWNLLDYSAGVLPVSHVDAKKDALPAPYKSVLKQLGANHAIARGAWKHYDAVKMAGLPTAVQVVGRRWQEEKVLGYMAAVEDALEEYYDAETGEGGKYQLLEI
ncbi:putative acetamidase [Aspergillus clavatus NRRL 1]|uniref:amidase n=1 Tax=Aspergillus clavatus (strain ATCC 1007 / CBS 513.65 / DSM 816 / NCTC 3887 / NRRL 1 / QM 1276 / 107) TaxID=344612 RepID=A1CG73_ASPCL|nr:acetamidase, putative [Aspergillus clavatus NRRL 1]EAW10953.1 acetamidase, putative [Aspergillus clavatus NRRL 1]